MKASLRCLRNCFIPRKSLFLSGFLAAIKAKGKTLFVDARNMGEMVNRRLREMRDKEDIQKIAKTFQDFNNGSLEDVKALCDCFNC